MSDKTSYAVVRDYDAHAFVDGVNDMIGKGWEPQGGIAFTNGQFLQAIVLRPTVEVVNNINVTSIEGASVAPTINTLIRDGGTA